MWLPERTDLACPACYFTTSRPARTGTDSLVPTILGMVAALAAHVAQQILIAAPRRQAVRDGNFLALGVNPYRFEALTIMARPDCPVCGRARSKDSDTRRPR